MSVFIFHLSMIWQDEDNYANGCQMSAKYLAMSQKSTWCDGSVLRGQLLMSCTHNVDQSQHVRTVNVL